MIGKGFSCLLIILNLFFIFNLEDTNISIEQKYTSIPDEFKKSLYGFIDKKGNIIIKPKFNAAYDFSEGLAGVSISAERKKMYIDRYGKTAIEKNFDYNCKFSEGLASVGIEKKHYYMNKDGKLVIGPFDRENFSLYDFQEGFAKIYTMNSHYSHIFINKKGVTIIKTAYKKVGGFSEGLAPVMVEQDDSYYDNKREAYITKEKWGFIDKKGNLIIKGKFRDVRSFSEGLAMVDVASIVQHGNIQERYGCRYGYINKKGKMVIKAKYDWAYAFSEGLAAVKKYKKKYFGYINKKGKYVIKPKFGLAKPFSEGLAAVMIKDKWGYINKEGKVVIEPKFDTGYYVHLYYFSEGLAAMPFNGKWGYINKEGNWIVKPQFIEAYPFSEGLARVKVPVGENGDK